MKYILLLLFKNRRHDLSKLSRQMDGGEGLRCLSYFIQPLKVITQFPPLALSSSACALSSLLLHNLDVIALEAVISRLLLLCVRSELSGIR